MENPKIHVTIDYTQFKFYEENRKIMEDHVCKLMKDKSFPEKFPTCPIIVNKDFYIIDGQHRFTAAKRLKIPIYFIKDDEANVEDIFNRNTKQKAWKNIDYINYYSKSNETYKFMLNVKTEYPSITVTLLIAIIGQISGIGSKFINKRLKEGQIVLNNQQREDLKDMLNQYIPFIQEMKKTRGLDAIVYFNRVYASSFAILYNSDRALFQKIIKKGIYCPYKAPYFNLLEDCLNFLLKVSNWRNTRANANAEWEKIDE